MCGSSFGWGYMARCVFFLLKKVFKLLVCKFVGKNRC